MGRRGRSRARRRRRNRRRRNHHHHRRRGGGFRGGGYSGGGYRGPTQMEYVPKTKIVTRNKRLSLGRQRKVRTNLTIYIPPQQQYNTIQQQMQVQMTQLNTQPIYVLPQGWRQAIDNNGKPYYINDINKTTQWEMPQGTIVQQQQQQQQTQQVVLPNYMLGCPLQPIPGEYCTWAEYNHYTPIVQNYITTLKSQNKNCKKEDLAKINALEIAWNKDTFEIIDSYIELLENKCLLDYKLSGNFFNGLYNNALFINKQQKRTQENVSVFDGWTQQPVGTVECCVIL